MRKCFFLISFFTVFGLIKSQSVGDFEQNIYFIAHTANNETFQINFSNASNYDELVRKCPPESTQLSIIIHGWSESYSKTLWVPEFMSNLTESREGCHLFMDYSKYSIGDYGLLVSYFKFIMPALVNQMKFLFDERGYDAKQAFIFGFSYGAHLAVQGSYTFGMRRIGRIDVCDPAYPYFYGDIDMALKFALAADIVQCIHTSVDYGTPQRYCPISWSMGNCGWSQLAAAAPPRGNHGLCPYFYTSAFKNDFKAVTKTTCTTTKPGVWKDGFVMGYRMNLTLGGLGEYFAETSNKPTLN